MITKFDIFLNEGYEEDYRKEYEERFGKKQTYEELKDKFKVGERIVVTRIDRRGGYDQECTIEDIFFDVMEGHWSAKLDNNTIRSLNQLRKI